MEKIKMYVEVRRLIEVETEINDRLADNLALGKAEPEVLTGLCSVAIFSAMEERGIDGDPKVIDYDFL